MSRILLVEDEPRIASFLEKGLHAQGYTTARAVEGREGLLRAASGEFDLVILDLGLPGMDGIEVLRRLRSRGGAVPVIILTARDAVEDTVEGLDTGADDYITKPFRFDELLARVRARLREQPSAQVTELTAGAVTLDLRARVARIGDRDIDLTAREFTMLDVLIRHPGQVLSREQLLSHVWGYDYDPGSNVVDVYIGYLRRKLGAGAITTVRGMGYRFDGGPEAGDGTAE
ncbi:MAG TPA: response regulator transcription factor [Egibacteraceae bacterium]|nr:response regulator transcription factor [Egibacteraceae bacterium]